MYMMNSAIGAGKKSVGYFFKIFDPGNIGNPLFNAHVFRLVTGNTDKWTGEATMEISSLFDNIGLSLVVEKTV